MSVFITFMAPDSKPVDVMLHEGMDVFSAVQAIASVDPFEATIASINQNPTKVSVEPPTIRALGGGAITFDADSNQIAFPNEVPPRTESLTRTEGGIFNILTRNPGMLVTKKAINDELFGGRYNDGAMRIHTGEIRGKLGPVHSNRLITVTGHGLLFLAD